MLMEAKRLDLASLKPKSILKLKISTPMEQLQTSKPNISKPMKRDGQHVCPVCRKGFGSGKALGGHIRIHTVRNPRHRKISKFKVKKQIYKEDEVADLGLKDDDEKIVCCICNKNFRSLKSLFGHMRNHPDRSWRGIRPPISEKKSGSSTISENDELSYAKDDDSVDEDEAMEAEQFKNDEAMEAEQNSVSDLFKISNRYEKFMSDDVVAARILMMLSRDKSVFSVSLPNKKWSKTNKASRDKSGFSASPLKIKQRRKGNEIGKTRSETESDQDFYSVAVGRTMLKSPKNEFSYDYFTGTKLNQEEADETLERNNCFDEEESDSPTIQLSQTPYFYPKKERFGAKALAEGNQGCSSTKLDIDLNEPCIEAIQELG